jgi:alkylation response protein AidB-like acyl-CoA dehydrogenase
MERQMAGDLQAFRAEVRAWIDANLPASLKGLPEAVTNQIGHGAKPAGDVAVWAERVAAKGWGAPTWPQAYGGAGLDGFRGAIVAQEMEHAGTANPINSMGIRMFGPTLLEYGTEAQKARHLPGIANATVRWCQGYSEPGAGSDLASLQTKCEDAGDHWRLNGQKIWTSGAQYADWCFCLVRTDPKRKHDGISFVLVDMRQPGVRVRPIPLINGSSPFCETFFTDARVEKDDMVGRLNGGWTVGKRLLQFERSNQANGRSGAHEIDLPDLARRYVGVDGEGRIVDADLRRRLTIHAMDKQAQDLTLQRVRAESNGGGDPSAATSVLKNSGTWIGQTTAELVLEILGQQGLGWEGEDFTPFERVSVRNWLYGKAMTILGGSQEIQNNIIAKRILGLPEA